MTVMKQRLNSIEAVWKAVIKLVGKVSEGIGVKDRALKTMATVLQIDVRRAF